MLRKLPDDDLSATKKDSNVPKASGLASFVDCRLSPMFEPYQWGFKRIGESIWPLETITRGQAEA